MVSEARNGAEETFFNFSNLDKEKLIRVINRCDSLMQY